MELMIDQKFALSIHVSWLMQEAKKGRSKRIVNVRNSLKRIGYVNLYTRN